MIEGPRNAGTVVDPPEDRLGFHVNLARRGVIALQPADSGQVGERTRVTRLVFELLPRGKRLIEAGHGSVEIAQFGSDDAEAVAAHGDSAAIIESAIDGNTLFRAGCRDIKVVLNQRQYCGGE